MGIETYDNDISFSNAYIDNSYINILNSINETTNENEFLFRFDISINIDVSKHVEIYIGSTKENIFID